jgi:signal transduction histidine kinase
MVGAMNDTVSTLRPNEAVRRDDLVFDGCLAVGLYLLLAASLFATPEAMDLDLGGGAYLAGAFITLPLAFRRRAPRSVFLVVVSALTVFRLIQGGEVIISSIAWFLAYYGLGRYGRHWLRNPLRIGNILAFIGLYVVAWLNIRAMPDGDALLSFLIVNMTIDAGILIAGWILGDRSREIHARAAELDRLARVQELERERLLHRAILEERMRIAREFHDVVGHHVSVVGIHAAGARRVLRRDPTRAEQALRSIEHASRQAVEEMQRALTLLRNEADDDPDHDDPDHDDPDHDDPDHDDPDQRNRHPGVDLPCLSSIEDVVEQIRGAGISVTSEVGRLPDLTASVQLAVTRVVQESLTNVLKHGGSGTSAWVTIDTVDDVLHVRVGDDGRGHPAPGGRRRGGRGLVGLQERIDLHGGSFAAGPRPAGGYEVRATIPLHRATTPATAGA